MTLIKNLMVAGLVLVTAACNGGNDDCNGTECDTDTVHTGETDDKPATSEITVTVTALGRVEDCVATLDDGKKTSITRPSGQGVPVHAGTWTITAGAINPEFESSHPLHVDPDGVPWSAPTATLEVADGESVDWEVKLNRYLEGGYRCSRKSYAHDPETGGPAEEPYLEYDHGNFTLTTLATSELKFRYESEDEDNPTFPAEDRNGVGGGEDNKYYVRENALEVSDLDGSYPNRMEWSNVAPNGDISWQLSNTDIPHTTLDFVPTSYKTFTCTKN